MTRTRIWVPGRPRPQGSKRHVGGGRLVEQVKGLPAWRKTVADAARKAHEGPPISGPVEVNLVFIFDRPKAHYRTGRNADLLRDDAPRDHVKPPDLDKLCRAVFDALTAAGVWGDDAQVVRLTASKTYPAPGLRDEGVIITVVGVP